MKVVERMAKVVRDLRELMVIRSDDEIIYYNSSNGRGNRSTIKIRTSPIMSEEEKNEKRYRTICEVFSQEFPEATDKSHNYHAKENWIFVELSVYESN